LKKNLKHFAYPVIKVKLLFIERDFITKIKNYKGAYIYKIKMKCVRLKSDKRSHINMKKGKCNIFFVNIYENYSINYFLFYKLLL